MLIPFRKMQAQGNDFAILELIPAYDTRLPLEELARDICDRRKGAGADGLVLLLADKEADARMLIYNSDGSRAAMCGSALRCCASLLYGLTGRPELTIATDSGIKEADYSPQGITVNLGKPRLLDGDRLAEGAKGRLIDVGNLHYVSFVDILDGQEHRLGPILEKHPGFPKPVNVEFVHVISRQEIGMRVWEAGAGATQACGTGSVASVFAGIGKGLLDRRVTVGMPGGKVTIEAREGGDYLLSGEVEDVFNGVYRWKI
jgi:diaminopimelate epimerase